MIALDRALISFYRLSIATMLLTGVGVGHKLQWNYFGMQSVPSFGFECAIVRAWNLFHRVAVSQSYSLVQTVFHHNTLCYK